MEHAITAEALQAALAPFEIFLSYRRSRSGDARALKMALVELGHRAFFGLDRDEGLGGGRLPGAARGRADRHPGRRPCWPTPRCCGCS